MDKDKLAQLLQGSQVREYHSQPLISHLKAAVLTGCCSQH